MESNPSASNSNQTFTVTSKDNLSTLKTYKILIEGGVKDSEGNSILSLYKQTTGFKVVDYLLPDTGQTNNYTNTFGEDSDYTINAPSFTNNGDGTVTDHNTGLIWQQQDDETKRTWSDAGTYCSNLSLGGYSDWRLPEAYELQTIVDFGTFNPSIDTTYFPNTRLWYYWSSTARVSDSSYVWFVIFSYGYVSYYSKASSLYVRCVRGGV